MKNINDWKQAANNLVNQYGYFTIGFQNPKEIGSIQEISYNPLVNHLIGKALITGASTYEEFLKQWQSQGYTCEKVIPSSFFYKCMVD